MIDWLLISLSFYALYTRIRFALRPEIRNFSPFATSYQEVLPILRFPQLYHLLDPAPRSPQVNAATLSFNSSYVFDSIAATFGILKIFRYCEVTLPGLARCSSAPSPPLSSDRPELASLMLQLQRNLLMLREAIALGVGELVIFTSILMIMIFGFALAGQNIFGQVSPRRDSNVAPA